MRETLQESLDFVVWVAGIALHLVGTVAVAAVSVALVATIVRALMWVLR